MTHSQSWLWLFLGSSALSLLCVALHWKHWGIRVLPRWPYRSVLLSALWWASAFRTAAEVLRRPLRLSPPPSSAPASATPDRPRPSVAHRKLLALILAVLFGLVACLATG